MWGQELALALLQLNNLLAVDSMDPMVPPKHAAFVGKIKSALQDVWKDAPTDVFDNT